jgi:cytochrome c oxidase subunit IV
MDHEKNHIVPYRTFLIILAVLVTLTIVSVSVTRIYLGPLTVAVALIIATIKSSFVLRIFMHLKFEKRFFAFAALAVIVLIAVVIAITLLDYLYR